MANVKRYLPLSWKGFAFPPLQVPARGVLLSRLDLSADLELILFTQGDATRALVAREMAFHHVAQGELEGHPYMISF
jgi:hypothetical protein